VRDLVSFAVHLTDLVGSRRGALDLAVRLSHEGTAALGPTRGDVRLFLEERGRQLGVVDARGRPSAIRAAELIVVCSILAEAGDRKPLPVPSPGLIFTVPEEAAELVPPGRRIALAVEDAIRMARYSLRLGGPFWDDPGFERLIDVLYPAVYDRGVQCSFYIHAWPEDSRRTEIAGRIRRLGPPEMVPIFWYRGPASSLIHAKFVVADSVCGLFGSANLTSYGFEHHVEVGVLLDPEQAQQLEHLLDGLERLGLFHVDGPATAPE
jgi:hypothetical protein